MDELLRLLHETVQELYDNAEELKQDIESKKEELYNTDEYYRLPIDEAIEDCEYELNKLKQQARELRVELEESAEILWEDIII